MVAVLPNAGDCKGMFAATAAAAAELRRRRSSAGYTTAWELLAARPSGRGDKPPAWRSALNGVKYRSRSSRYTSKINVTIITTHLKPCTLELSNKKIRS
jgi:hypothetical protein